MSGAPGAGVAGVATGTEAGGGGGAGAAAGAVLTPAVAGGGGGRIARAAGVVSLATMLSRVLGLARDMLFAALLGASAGPQADAFVVAFRIPNLLRDLFAEGALSAAFVPTFARALRNDGREAAVRLANRVATALLLILGALTVVGILAAGLIVSALAPGFSTDPHKHALTTQLTRILFPFLPLVSLAALAMGMLTAQDRFAPPALAPAMFNVVSILAGGAAWGLGLGPDAAAVVWAVGALLGGGAQLVAQLPALASTGWRPRIDLRLADPGLARVGRLMLPATVGLAATQVNIFVNTVFASQVPGAATWLNNAFRLMQLPIGVFGVAVATVATAKLAQRAAEKDLEGLSAALRQSLGLVAFLTIPSTVGLLVLADPIIALLFQRGRFLPQDTLATAQALVFYCVGLFAYASVKVVAPAFYALDQARVPMVASLVAVVANVALNFALFPVLGFKGLALGTSAAALANFLVLALAFSRRHGTLFDRATWLGLGKIVFAAAAMGGSVFEVHRALLPVAPEGLAGRLVLALGPVVLGAAAYALCAWILRVEELALFVRAMRRRRSR